MIEFGKAYAIGNGALLKSDTSILENGVEVGRIYFMPLGFNAGHPYNVTLKSIDCGFSQSLMTLNHIAKAEHLSQRNIIKPLSGLSYCCCQAHYSSLMMWQRNQTGLTPHRINQKFNCAALNLASLLLP